MIPSLYHTLTEQWGASLTPYYLPLGQLQSIFDNINDLTSEIVEDGIIAFHTLPDAPFNRTPFAHRPTRLYAFNHAAANAPQEQSVPIAEADLLANEWFMVVATPSFSYLLCARNTNLCATDESSRYALLWTIDPAKVETALSFLQAYAAPLEVVIPTPTWEPTVQNINIVEIICRRIGWSLMNEQNLFAQTSDGHADYQYRVDFSSDKEAIRFHTTPTFAAITGYSPEFLANNGWDLLIPPEDMPSYTERHAILSQGQPDTREVRIITRDGETLWLLDTAIPEWDPVTQRVVQIHGAVRDITTQKQTEARLHTSEARYVSLFENAPVMTITTSYRNDIPIITSCNHSFLEMLGYQMAEVVGQPLGNFYTAASQEALTEQYFDAKQGHLRARELITKDGRVIATLMQAIVLPREGDEPFGTHAMFIDMTESKRVEMALQEVNLELEQRIVERTASLEIANRVLNQKIEELERAQALIQAGQERLEDFFTSTTDLVSLISGTGKILYVNDAWRTTLGYLSEDIGKLKSVDVTHPDDAPRISAQVLNSLRHGEQVLELSYRLVTKDKRVIYCEGISTLRTDLEGNIEIQSVFRDVTARTLAENRQREEHERYRLLTRSVPDTVLLLIDHQMHYILAEGDTRALIGLSQAEIEGKTVRELLPTDLADIFEPYYLRALAGESLEFNFANQGKMFEIRIQLIREENAVPYLIMIAVDITEKAAAEQVRQEQEARYRLVARSMPNTILLLYDHDLRYTLAEGNTLHLVGLSRDFMEGKTLYETLDPDGIRDLEEPYRRTLQGEEQQFVLYYRERIFNVQMRPLYENNVISLGMIVAEDVTSKIAIERKRKEQEAMYQTVVENIPDTAILVYDHDLRFIIARGTSPILHTFESENMPSKTLWDIVEPAFAEQTADLYQKAFSEEQIEVEISYEGKTYHVQILPIILEGNVQGGMLLAQDITKRKQAERARLESEARYRLVAESIPDSAVFLFDHDFRFTLAEGPALRQVINYGHPLEGHTLKDVLSPEMVSALEPIYKAALSGESVKLDLPAQNRYYNVRAMPVRVDDQVTGGLILAHDISERKQFEESLRAAKEIAEEATRAKSTFLANMSHEIRTPLNAIVGATGLLLNTELTSKQKEYAGIVRVSSDSLLALVSDILDFSKIEADKLILEERPFDLRACIEESLDLLQPQAAAKKLELIYIMEPEAPEWVIGDKNRVRQILMNLLSNAVKFTAQGDIQVTVSRHQEATGETFLDLAVRDSGIGMTNDQFEAIFEAFTQADTSTTRRYGGTGLGLAICKRLAILMGGHIWVDSKPNVGSTFHVMLRLEPSSPHPLAFPTDDVPHLTGKRILIVVANTTTRLLITQQVRRWGMRPLVSALEQTALAFLRQPNPPFDMVLWDGSISDHSNSPLFQVMRDRAEQHSIPVVLLGTAYPAASDSSTLPHTAFLHKPFKPGRLYEILTNLVEGVSLGDKSSGSNYLLDSTLGERYPLTILLAEDNLVNQRVTMAILERLGYQAELVSNGREALDATRRRTYDVILMDVQMPGLEATQLIRRLSDRIAQPYIIALTANAMQGDREQYLMAGMDAYLSKPVDIAALQGTLQKASEYKQNRAARSVMAGSQKAHPVLERNVLEQLRNVVGNNMIEPVATVIDLFLEEAPHYVNMLQQAIAIPDLLRVVEVAHTLKSSSAALGGMAFSARCATIEAHSAAGRLMEASLAVNQLTDEFHIFAAALLGWRRDATRNR